MPVKKKTTKRRSSKVNKDKIIETLYQELKRKDAIIDKLKEVNHVLMQTALKNTKKKLEEK